MSTAQRLAVNAGACVYVCVCVECLACDSPIYTHTRMISACRCGWLDLPVVQYSHALNDYTSINITKLDVLSGLDEIHLGTHYTLHGERLPRAYMPSLLSELAEIKVRVVCE
jgi:hypothetical protein